MVLSCSTMASWTDAVNALQDAANNAPKDAFIQYWLGKAALAKGDSGLAEKSFRQAAQLNPPGLEAQEELARMAAQRGDMGMLADVADKTISTAPRFLGGYLWRATVEVCHNEADKAEADLKTATNIAPQNRAGLSHARRTSLGAKTLPGRQPRCSNRLSSMTPTRLAHCAGWWPTISSRRNPIRQWRASTPKSPRVPRTAAFTTCLPSCNSRARKSTTRSPGSEGHAVESRGRRGGYALRAP